MLFTYELTQRDFYEAIIAHRNRTVFSKWTLRVVLAVVILVLSFSVLVAAVTRNAHFVLNFAPLWVLCFLWILLLLGLPHLQARKQFVKQPAAHGPRTLRVDTVGTHWNWDGGSSSVEWRMFFRWLESKNHFLLYGSPVFFYMVPKRAFTPEEIPEFRSLLQQHIIRKK